MATEPRARDELVIEAGGAGLAYWRDLWRYRELMLVFAWRDLAVRYKQTAIGVAWAVLLPLAQMLVMVLVFAKLARLPAQGNVPYPLMVFAAILPWQFFASAISSSSMSVAANANLVTKVYFPRIVLPVAGLATSFADFLVALAILAALMLWYGYAPGWRILTLPAFILLAIPAAFGPGLLIAAMNARYRDFRYLVPFVVQFGLYVSPVGFSSELVRERFGDTLYYLYALNPMVGVIEGFRWAILGGSLQAHLPALGLSLLVSSLLCWAGFAYFRRMERGFADVI